MVDTQLSNVRVFAEDSGTGAPAEPGQGDFVSAGDLGALALQSGDGNHVEHGFDLTLSNATTVDVGVGLLFARFGNGVTVQDSQTGEYSVTLDIPVVFGCYSTGVTGLSLDADAVNDIWVSVDETGGDSAFVRHGSSITEPSAPAVKIGEIDTTDGTVTQLNRGPSQTFDDLAVSTSPTGDTDAVRKTDLDTHTGDTANPHSVTLEQARQSGSFEGPVSLPVDGLNVGGGQLSVSGFDLIFGAHDQSTRGDTGQSRALSKVANGALAINPDGDFSAVDVPSPLRVGGEPVRTEGRPTPQPTTDHPASWGEIVFGDASGGGFAVTLPPLEAGRELDIVKDDGTQNALSITPPGDQQISGQSSLDLTVPYRSRTITCNDTDYYVL